MLSVRDLLLILGAYALGCVTTGYYLVRLRTGEDIREHGSGSVGATNVGRSLGRGGFLLTLAADAARGAIAIAAGRVAGADSLALLLMLLAVVCGHVWPIQLRFRGGKGIAPALGALSVYDEKVLLGAFLVFAGVYAIGRRFVLCGLITVALLPVVALALRRPPLEAGGLALLVAVILIAHRGNVRPTACSRAVER